MKELIEIDLGVRDEDIPTAEIKDGRWPGEITVEGYGKGKVWVGAMHTQGKFTFNFGGVVQVNADDDGWVVTAEDSLDCLVLRGGQHVTDAMIEEASNSLLLVLRDNGKRLAELARDRVAQDRRREVAQARARVEQLEDILKSARETLAAAVDAEQNG